ncbi:streptophobe family protein [Streptomyces sp. NRRL S-340]|uniref:streptophobe family protein n=1 Tax=Streptomyces sp. NRRL S-340 TaxID=1463901 RepID=UPI001F3BB70B|nr:streptophobe family protein [Streptomyces sp. NRRL S-340]
MAAMGVVAALGLWAAGAADLPGDAFPRVVAATVVTAVGGSMRLTGNAGMLAETHAGVTVMPLSVSLTGALVLGAGFLHPLRHRAAAGAREPAFGAARIAVLWLAALTGLAFAARQRFAVDLGDGVLGAVGGLLGVEPEVGFTTDVGQTAGFGLLWLAGVLASALLSARTAAVPARLPWLGTRVRPVAYALVVLLLSYVVLGLVVALVTAGTRGHPAQTFALILLGLPNLTWLAFTIGLGATWHGRVDGPFGLPVPRLLDEVLRTPDVSTLDLGTLAGHDGRVWWLVVVDAVLLSAAAFLAGVLAPAATRPWRHAVHMAVGLVLTVLLVCLSGRISAHYGLSLLGIGDVGGGLSGELLLRPRLWSALGLAALWGLVTGFLGAAAARRVRRRDGAPPGPGRPASGRAGRG